MSIVTNASPSCQTKRTKIHIHTNVQDIYIVYNKYKISMNLRVVNDTTVLWSPYQCLWCRFLSTFDNKNKNQTIDTITILVKKNPILDTFVYVCRHLKTLILYYNPNLPLVTFTSYDFNKERVHHNYTKIFK
jgi:hypothetical protein